MPVWFPGCGAVSTLCFTTAEAQGGCLLSESPRARIAHQGRVRIDTPWRGLPTRPHLPDGDA
eukprot:4713038-Alexandrium_andersonii.AAC.1